MVRKFLSGALEIKSLAEDGTFAGHGSVFGVKDSYGDVVEPGAFQATLESWGQRGRLPKLLLQHDPKSIIGKWTTMREDARGLYVEGKLFLQLGLAKSTHTLMREGELDGLSIGFSLPDGGSVFDKVAGVNRIKAVDLWEVSVVTFAANDQASVEAVKSAPETVRQLESALRDAGLSREQAKRLMARGSSALGLRDAGNEGDEVDPLQFYETKRKLERVLLGG
jgi:HK97 family phage prohead protease